MGTKKRVNKYPKAFQLMALERMNTARAYRHWRRDGNSSHWLYHWKNHLKAIVGGFHGCDETTGTKRIAVADIFDRRELFLSGRVLKALSLRSVRDIFVVLGTDPLK